ncbi:MAG: VOC family protein [Bacteroidota bacterium]|jgi:predicted enzyme related to lactoylglutathione lyase
MKKKTQNARFDFIEFPAKSLDDLLKTKSFYSFAFGWSYKDWGNDYSDTKDSGLGSGLNADPSHKSGHPLAVIYVDAIEVSKKAVVAAGGQITRDIFSFPGVRRFHFTDPTGNELAVWPDK